MLSVAIKQKFETHCLSFKYQQRHKTEIFFAKKQVEEQQPKTHKIVNLDFFGGSSLTDNIKVPKHKDVKLIPNTIPNTYVPGRNLIFLSYALGYAEYLGCNSIFIGVNSVDYSGYPDCRDVTIKTLNKAINLGMEKKFKFHTPLMFLTKAQTWKLSYTIGGEKFVNIIKNFTHTCYKGNRKKLFSWGYGCGKCPACIIRKKGWEEYNLEKKYEI